MRILLLLIVSLWSCYALAQSEPADWQELLHEWMTAEDMEEDFGSEALELMAERAETKINLNQTTREELEELPFLSAQQVEGIMEYIYRYGPMRSLPELQLVTALDRDTRRLLECFVYAGEGTAKRTWPKWSNVAKYGRQQLMVTAKIPTYERKGDRNGYLGYPFRHDLRYQFQYNDRIKFGLTGSQDAGEPFFAGQNKLGYDHYSYYFQLRKMGKLESLNLGMYRVQLGMGLIINTGFHLGKLATLQSLARSTHAITAHASRSETGYLQGAAATVRLDDHWQVTAFASYRPQDATLNADGTARTLLKDGYHRTPTEMEKKHNTHETDLGLSAGYRHGTFYVRANALYTRLDRPLMPQKETALYRRYALEGNDFANASLDYGYTNARLSFSGETAVNRNGALAALHAVSVRCTETLSLLAIHRYYDKRYTALHARSFSEGAGVQNEHGVYLGATWRPVQRLTLQWYADYAHFPWLRYQVSMPSDAFDTMLSARYTAGPWSVESRYRLHIRQRDNAEKTWVENRTEHRCQLKVGYQAGLRLSFQTQADAVSVSFREQDAGLMLAEEANWQWRWLRVNGRVAWFHTSGYESRLYQYEQSVRYDFSFPAYYGHGLRYALTARADVGKRWMFIGKVGVTDYFNRSTISSGLQEIAHSSMADVLLQASRRL